MNNYLLTPLGGALRLSHKTDKTYKPHKTYKPYKPLLHPIGGTEGGSDIIYNVAMNAKKQPPGIALHSFLRNFVTATVGWESNMAILLTNMTHITDQYDSYYRAI